MNAAEYKNMIVVTVLLMGWATVLVLTGWDLGSKHTCPPCPCEVAK